MERETEREIKQISTKNKFLDPRWLRSTSVTSEAFQKFLFVDNTILNVLSTTAVCTTAVS